MRIVKNIVLHVCFLTAFSTSYAQPKTDAFLLQLLQANKDSVLQKVLQHPEVYRYQVIYTQINRDSKNRPSAKNYYLNVDSLLYFNPASTVKMPLAFLSLEKLNNMQVKSVDRNTAMQFDSAYTKQRKLYKDSTSANGLPSIAHFIKKAFIVSDNDAYNRMYQFLGQQTINAKLHAKGYRDARITRQFAGFTQDENRHTNPIRFINDDGSLIYHQHMAFNTDSFDFSHTYKIGTGYFNRNDSLVKEPFDFTMHNNLSLQSLQQLLQSVMLPASVPAAQRFNFKKDDYRFLYQYLSQYPSETNYPFYDTSKFYDSYVKFYFDDSSHHIPSYIRIFNKVGWAYGFSTDVSYIVDFKNKVEFMITANIYVNSDGILNDDKYDYESIGQPFLYQLGQTIYQYELKRKRSYKPNLNAFNVTYEHRNASDKRHAIKEVDN